jgi:hypothetical protein
MKFKFSKCGKFIYRIAFIFAVLNFVITLALYEYLGGSAYNGGYIKDGHYFLSHKWYVTEISKNIWQLSYYQEVILWISFPLFFVIGAILRKTGDMKQEDNPQS